MVISHSSFLYLLLVNLITCESICSLISECCIVCISMDAGYGSAWAISTAFEACIPLYGSRSGACDGRTTWYSAYGWDLCVLNKQVRYVIRERWLNKMRLGQRNSNAKKSDMIMILYHFTYYEKIDSMKQIKNKILKTKMYYYHAFNKGESVVCCVCECFFTWG